MIIMKGKTPVVRKKKQGTIETQNKIIKLRPCNMRKLLN